MKTKKQPALKFPHPIDVPNVTVKFHDWTCKLRVGYYTSNRRNALMLADAETGEPIATASVNLIDQMGPGSDGVHIKDYSENEGIMAALLRAGIISNDFSNAGVGWKCTIIHPDVLAAYKQLEQTFIELNAPKSKRTK